jgi:hypothetical protein
VGLRYLGWREGLALAALVLLLVYTVPLLVCLPLTWDTIAYDVCARTVLRGGVLYRDAFDNNLPGAVWIHCAVRGLFGERTEVLRGFDLIVVGAVIALLMLWLARAGRSRAALVVTAALLFGFYSSRTEWCQCQRDTWMLLPALAALHLRKNQVDRLRQPETGTARVALTAVVEGLLWGAAFWIKPFVALPALACWLVAALLVRAAPVRISRRLALDATGLLLGGVVAGAVGVAWLVRTGAWPAFWDVFTNWNREYYAGVGLSARLQKLPDAVRDFFPWWLALLAAVPVAVVALRRAVAGRPLSEPAQRQALLAAFFVGLVIQAFFLQRPLFYVFVPPGLIGLALLAGTSPPAALRRPVAGLLAAFVVAAVWLHPLLWKADIWDRCWREGSTPEVRGRLRIDTNSDWVAEGKVADYLRGRVGDGELTCFDATTIAAYWDVGVEPSTRYVYLNNILLIFRGHADQVRADVAASRQRYVVTDWTKTFPTADEKLLPGDGECAEPDGRLAALRPQFPWSEPVVFRAGRYLVHRARAPEPHGQ